MLFFNVLVVAVIAAPSLDCDLYDCYDCGDE